MGVMGSEMLIFIGALAATAIELLPLHIDDNLTMALASALVMSLAKGL